MKPRRVTVLKKEVSWALLIWAGVGILAAVALAVAVFWQAASEDPAEPYFRCIYGYFGGAPGGVTRSSFETGDVLCRTYKPDFLTPEQAWTQYQEWYARVRPSPN